MRTTLAVLASGLLIAACSNSASPPAAESAPPGRPQMPIAQLPAIDADAVLAHTNVLSSDEYEGRGPGTKARS